MSGVALRTPPPPLRPALDSRNLALRLGTAGVFAVFFLTLLYEGDRPASQAIFALLLAGALLMGMREFTAMGRKLLVYAWSVCRRNTPFEWPAEQPRKTGKTANQPVTEGVLCYQI